MAITVADFRAHLDAASTALGISDWSEVRKRIGQARLALAGIPSGKMSASDVQWARDDLKALADEARRAEAATNTTTKGLQFTKVTYARASD